VKGGIRGPRTPGGTWAYRLDRGAGPDGRRRQEQLAGFACRQEAEAALATALAAQGGGNPKTVAGFLERVWLPAKRPEVERSTFDQYAWAVRRHIVPGLGAVAVSDLTPGVVQDWLAGVVRGESGRALGATSARLVRKVLSMALGEAVDRGLIGDNPVKATKGPPRTEPVRQSWTADQATRFLSAASGHHLGVAFELVLATGLRRGELLGLRWSDIDFDGGRIRIGQQLVMEGGRARLRPIRPGVASAIVDLDPRTVARLVAHRACQREVRVVAGEVWAGLGLVFTTPNGGWVSPERFAAVMDELVEAAQVPRITSEGLRRTGRHVPGAAS